MPKIICACVTQQRAIRLYYALLIRAERLPRTGERNHVQDRLGVALRSSRDYHQQVANLQRIAREMPC